MAFPIEVTMTLILGLIGLSLYAFSFTLSKKDELQSGHFLPDSNNQMKREFEIFALSYTAVWIAVFAVVIVLQLYEQFDAQSYMTLCVSLALPFLLQPLLAPLPAESKLPLVSRYSFKINVAIAIFSYIGNYWYTHYFYDVLGARYSFPSHRWNDVPIALYFATHFYFVTYHTFANLLLRKVETKYVAGALRSVFFWMVVFAFSYFTAFMETLTISSFPYYSFTDRYMAYTLGSAFYGLYFIVSFPLFYRLDEYVVVSSKASGAAAIDYSGSKGPASIVDVVILAMGAGMIVLLLLDTSRLLLGIELDIPGVAYYLYQPPVSK